MHCWGPAWLERGPRRGQQTSRRAPWGCLCPGSHVASQNWLFLSAPMCLGPAPSLHSTPGASWTLTNGSWQCAMLQTLLINTRNDYMYMPASLSQVLAGIIQLQSAASRLLNWQVCICKVTVITKQSECLPRIEPTCCTWEAS